MGLWPRVLVVAIAVVVGALLLKVLPPIVVLVAFVGGIVVAYTGGRRRAREPERRDGTDLLGLKREDTDPFGIVEYPLALFGRAAAPRVEELVWGAWRSLEVHAFGLSFEPSVLGQDGERWTFACAMARVPASLPAFVAEPQTFLAMLQGPPPAASVRLGDPWFDREMHLWCEDEAFGREALDPAMREWLGALDPPWGVELLGHIALVYGPKPERPDVVTTLETLKGLLDRLPRDEAATHPPGV
jgi:hypothetical protein